MKHYHIVSRIAIYLLAVVFIIFGIFHFIYPEDLLVYVPNFLPGGIRWAYLVGASFILVGISFITNQYVKFTSYLTAGFLLFFILTIHVPNSLNAGDAEMRQWALVNILKDLAIWVLHYILARVPTTSICTLKKTISRFNSMIYDLLGQKSIQTPWEPFSRGFFIPL